jgi:hypothetical protein
MTGCETGVSSGMCLDLCVLKEKFVQMSCIRPIHQVARISAFCIDLSDTKGLKLRLQVALELTGRPTLSQSHHTNTNNASTYISIPSCAHCVCGARNCITKRCAAAAAAAVASHKRKAYSGRSSRHLYTPQYQRVCISTNSAKSTSLTMLALSMTYRFPTTPTAPPQLAS